MRFPSSIVSVFLTLTAATAFPADREYHRFAPRQTTLSWIPCFSNPQLECALFEPPLDYANPAAGKASLAVIKHKATKTPRLGTLFGNPGGPGGSGVGFIVDGGALLSNWSGGYYDIVSWDPRGVNNSLPKVECFLNGIEETSFWGYTIPYYGIEARTGFNDTKDVTFFYSQLSQTDEVLRRFGQKCQQMSGDNLKYIGTAAAARDLVGLADALEGPTSPINYIGFSYGTLIGAYFVNMFPNRVGRIVLDGVVNPQIRSAGPAHKAAADQIQDSEKVLQAFYEQCAAAGTRCSLSRGTSGTLNPTQIRSRLLNLVEVVYVAVLYGLNIGTQNVRDFIFGYMYLPRYWQDLSDELVYLEQQLALAFGPGFTASTVREFASQQDTNPNPSTDRQRAKLFGANVWYMEDRDKVYDFLKLPLDGGSLQKRQRPAPSASDWSNVAITCADSIDAGAVTTKDVFDEIIRVSREVSPMFGPSFSSAGYFCHRWPVRATERYAGPWNAKLANPILVIGNRADPVTPLASAKFLADQLGDSAVLIEHDGLGHTSLGMYSSCTTSLISGYFISGTVPTNHTTCSTNVTLFTLETRQVPSATFTPVPATPIFGTLTASLSATPSASPAREGSGGQVLRADLKLWIGLPSFLALGFLLFGSY